MVETQLKAIRNYYRYSEILGHIIIVLSPFVINYTIDKYNSIWNILLHHLLVGGLTILLLIKFVKWHKSSVISKKYFVANITVTSIILVCVLAMMTTRICTLHLGINKIIEYLTYTLSIMIFVCGVSFEIGNIVIKSTHTVINENFTETALQVQAYKSLPITELNKKYGYHNLLFTLGALSLVSTFVGCLSINQYLEKQLSIAFGIILILIAITAITIGSIIELKLLSKKYAIALLITKVMYFALLMTFAFVLQNSQPTNSILAVILAFTGLLGFAILVQYIVQFFKIQTQVKKDIKCILLPLYKQSLELDKQADTNTTSTM